MLQQHDLAAELREIHGLAVVADEGERRQRPGLGLHDEPQPSFLTAEATEVLEHGGARDERQQQQERGAAPVPGAAVAHAAARERSVGRLHRFALFALARTSTRPVMPAS